MPQSIRLGTLEDRLEVSAPPDAEGGRWLYLSAEWWGVIQALLDLLDNDEVWASDPVQSRGWLVQAMLGMNLEPVGVSTNCQPYPTQSELIEYRPAHPYINSEQIVVPFQNPLWTRGEDSSLAGAKSGDVYFTLANVVDDPNPFTMFSWIIENIGEFFGADWDLSNNPLPRFRVKFSGAGECELHMLKVPQGGLALVSLDGKPNQIVDCQSISIGDWNSWTSSLSVLGWLGLGALTGSLVSEEIVEVKTRLQGNHYIDVTFIPKISGFTSFIIPEVGWGGGLREVVICGAAGRQGHQPPPLRGRGGLQDLPNFRDVFDPELIELILEIEGDCEMANCGCGASQLVRYCDGKLQYKNQVGDWVDIPGDAIKDPAPPVVTPGETTTINNACWKANGVWAAIAMTAEKLIESMADASTNIGAYNAFQQNSEGIDADNLQLMDAIGATFQEVEEIAAQWSVQKIDIRDDFLCAILNQFDNTSVLTDGDISKIREFEWFATGSLLNFLEEVDDVPESRWLKVMARNYVMDASTSCPCNNLGVAPEPELPTDWEFDTVFEGEYSLLTWNAGVPSLPTGEIYDDPDFIASGLQATPTLLEDNPPPTARRVVAISHSIAPESDTKVKSVEIWFSDLTVASPNDGSAQRQMNIRFFTDLGLGEGMEGSPTIAFATTDGYKKFEFADFSLAEFVAMRLFFQVAQHSGSGVTTVGGNGVIQRVKVRGSGANPFA